MMPIEEESPFIIKNVIGNPAPFMKKENPIKQKIDFYAE